MRIVDVVEITKPIASPIRNAYIDFSKMTASLVAVVTDVMRDGRRVVYELYDDHVADLLDQVVGHVEHVRLGQAGRAA